LEDEEEEDEEENEEFLWRLGFNLMRGVLLSAL